MSQNLFYVGVARNDNGRGIVLGGHANHTEVDLKGIRQVLEQPGLDITPGKHYSFTVSDVAWHLIQGIFIIHNCYSLFIAITLLFLHLICTDEYFIYYVLICKQYYPQRVAHACLDELQRQVSILVTTSNYPYLYTTIYILLFTYYCISLY